MVLFLSLCLFLVMLAQGAAFRPADFSATPEARRTWRALAAKLLVLPLVAWLCGWSFGLTSAAQSGLMLLALAPAGMGSVAFAAVTGADLPRLRRLIALSTVTAIVWLPLVASPTLDVEGVSGTISAMLLVVALPFALGMALRPWLGAGARWLAPGASLLSGAMILITLWYGWTASGWEVLQAVLVLALAAALMGTLAARRAGPEGRAHATAFALALLIVETAVPIGLAARLWGADFAAVAMPAALYAILSYALAILLIVTRLARRS
ncbi:hypothetical protein MLD63_05160 [Paracoccus sp. TK19116]|uniref:Uncharacterized protein n=1 Tax=Paracoccus albicereus TaxID=2922394 RepID=A0ABT1MNF2_9RHOB|nr:hypothetical protein [Paracoccus albicereus]MCQ0969817.1 hypothetical protein [Paracoccus albicereus]